MKEFRKNGIASFLLDNLVAHLTNPYNDPPTDDVHALYLHVLTTNSQAIAFYEHRGFRAHMFLPYYYAIKGKHIPSYNNHDKISLRRLYPRRLKCN